MFATELENRLAQDIDGRYARFLIAELHAMRHEVRAALCAPQIPAEREQLQRLDGVCDAALQAVRRISRRMTKVRVHGNLGIGPDGDTSGDQDRGFAARPSFHPYL
ncbi:EscE/YscE/SsaE family type III secretion system needle protein co-chaperone [Cupriavidus pampae]|uniref:EscE/YscE/SsaE family type III secretion system needle protein co-chaperone n=1 Tax=Cupriavidus pampae TaxID=659251 RepID=UPI001CC664D5|nr:EscE/YscE/SsaE family type III secretion system needle protein co-chaperone [Cupriavidus pampae]